MKKYLSCVLKESVNRLGKKSDNVKIKGGYARFLLNNKQVYILSKKSNLESMSKIKVVNVVNKIIELVKKVETIDYVVKVNKENVLYDSIKKSKVLLILSDYIKQEKINFIKCDIKECETITLCGSYKISLEYQNNNIHNFNLNVIKEVK
ncbi:50S ribosomal protein L9 [bacterium AB1]|nr:50S ribosomal protein L9 [bacterium AB1]